MTVVQKISSEQIGATIQAGEINGQVAIGKYVLQIGDVNGGVVNIAMPEQQPGARPRPGPIDLRPRRFRGLLDRKTTVENASAALQAARPVELTGQEGIGKTSLLRHLAHQPLADAFADGVVFLSARQQGAGDLHLALFDAFYDRDMAYKPTETQIKHALRDKKALILLDDVDLTRADLEQLMDAAPDCTFLLASQSGHLWGEGHVLTLPGLPLADGLALLAREMGRPLSKAEGPAAKAIWRGVSGHPLLLILAATAIRFENIGLHELARLIEAGSAGEVLVERLVERRPAREKRALAALAALGGAPADAGQIASITGLSDAKPVLDTLSQGGLVQIQGGRYALGDFLAHLIDQVWELTPWRERILDYFLESATGWRPDVGQILTDLEALRQTAAWALETERWSKVTSLVKAIEGALAQSGRWDAWSEALSWAFSAARAVEDQATVAWALHQIGTRALCLAERAVARQALIQALRLREALGDRAGTAVTRHNLQILLGPPAPPRKPPGDASPPPANGGAAGGTPLLLKAATVLLFVATVTLAGFLTGALAGEGSAALPTAEPATLFTATPTARRPAQNIPTATPTDKPTHTPTATSTATPTATPSNTPTSTATPTNTPTSTPCGPPWGWPLYTVRRGDTLYAIGRATGASVWQLKLANCLVGDRIDAGQRLFVPRLPRPVYTEPTETPRIVPDDPTPTHTPTPTEEKRPEKKPPTDTPTPTYTPTHTPTPTPTDTPTPTPTDTPVISPVKTRIISCAPLEIESLTADVDQAAYVRWSVYGGCQPLYGTLIAQYRGEEPYKTYQYEELGPDGSQTDYPPYRCEGTSTVLYTLKLSDATGQSAEKSIPVETNHYCEGGG